MVITIALAYRRHHDGVSSLGMSLRPDTLTPVPPSGRSYCRSYRRSTHAEPSRSRVRR
jgi:hypothetical protein